MKKKGIVVLLLSTILMFMLGFYGCGDDGTDNGTGTGTGEPNWIPMSDGNFWEYKYVANIGPFIYVAEIKYEMLKDTTLSDNNVYKKVKASYIQIQNDSTTTEVQTQFWAEVNGYFRIAWTDSIAKLSWLDVLKIPVNKGDKWQADPMDATSTGTVLGFEDVTSDSLSKTFTSCPKVQLYLKNDEGEHETSDYWYADRVGLVKIFYEDLQMPFILTNYSVK